MRREIPYNFGALPPLPNGYSVIWRESHEHYQAIGPDEWEGNISVDPYWCRRQAICHAGVVRSLDDLERLVGDN